MIRRLSGGGLCCALLLFVYAGYAQAKTEMTRNDRLDIPASGIKYPPCLSASPLFKGGKKLI
jgi:hypothetical protein